MARAKISRGPRGSIDVLVLDHAMRPLPKAEVRLIDSGTRREVKLGFEEGRRRYRAEGIPAGPYLLRVRLRGRQSDERDVVVEPGGGEAVIVLGTRGQPAYRRGKVRVPFDPRPELIGLTVRSADRSGQEDLDRLERELGLTRREIPASLETGAPWRRVWRLAPRRTKWLGDKERRA